MHSKKKIYCFGILSYISISSYIEFTMAIFEAIKDYSNWFEDISYFSTAKFFQKAF